MTEKENGKPYLSPHLLDSLLRCGIRFKYFWIDKIQAPKRLALLRGSAVHASRKYGLIHKLQQKPLPPAEAVIEHARDSFVANFDAGNIWLTPEEKEIGLKKLKGQYIDVVTNMAAVDYEQHIVKANPQAVEHRIILKLDGYPYNLKGRLDEIDRLQTDDGKAIVVVRDLKTKRKNRPRRTEADESDQLTVYSMLWHAEQKQPVNYAVLDCVTQQQRGYVWDSLVTKRTVEDYQILLNRLAAAWEAIEKGVFLPAAEHRTCMNCPYAPICPYCRRV